MPLFNLEDYEYKNLPLPTSIRLLRLCYNQGAVLPSLCGYPIIQCRLETVDLRDNPQYEALSYTWDSPLSEMQKRATDTWTDEYGPLSKWPISIDGRLLFIRKNLFDALRHLQNMQDVDRKDPGNFNKTLLHVAAEDGDLEGVTARLLQGASCGARDNFGETPLHYAAENGHYEVVKALVASGAETGLYDNWGRQPIHCCTQRKHRDWARVAEFLRDPSRTGNQTGLRGEPNDTGKGYLESRGDYDKTPLISAAESGDLREVRDLVGRGADLLARDCFGETPLHYAAENGHYEVVVELILGGASTHYMLTKKDDEDRTPLDCCLQQKRGRHEEVAKFLGDEEFRKAEIDRMRLERLEMPSAGPSESTYFWIDAICINQSNLDERNAQVRIMPNIYQQASCVIVWLGFDRNLEQQMDRLDCDMNSIMRRVNRKANKLKRLQRQWSVSLQSFFADEILDWDVPEGGILCIAEIRTVVKIFLRSWFTRAWVVQELALAKKIKMFLGEEELDWHQVLKFLCLLAHVGLFHSSAFWKIDQGFIGEDSKGGNGSEAWKLVEVRLRTANDPKEWEIVESIQQQKQCKAPRIHRGGRLSLPLLLANCWSFESKDPRDKIHALLNLASPLPENEPIVIDYKSPVEDLYTQMAYIFLRGSDEEPIYEEESLDYAFDGILEPLEGLSFIQDPFYSDHQARMPGLPTWVPDFSNALVTSRIWRSSFSAAIPKGIDLHPIFGPGESQKVLRVVGIEADEVADVEQRWAGLDVEDMQPDLNIDIPSWLSMLDNLTLGNGESPIKVLFRTLTLDTLWKDCHKAVQDNNVKSFREFMTWELATIMKGEPDSSLESTDYSTDHSLSTYSDSESEDNSDPDEATSSTLARSAKAPKSPTRTSSEELKEPQEIDNSIRDGDNLDNANNNCTTDSEHNLPGKTSEDGCLPDGSHELDPSLSEALDRQRTLDQECKFLPSQAEILACIGDAHSSGWCKYHGSDCNKQGFEDSFRFQMVRNYRKRCLFRTRSGRLGLGPQTVRPGDKVCLIKGSRTPHLLRDQEFSRGYKFLGEAFVHGIMYGEAIADEASMKWDKLDIE